MNFFSSPPINLLRRAHARPLRSSVGQEASPYKVDEIEVDSGEVAIFTLIETGLPIWAYANDKKSNIPIWLYLARAGIPIFSVNQSRWTSVSKYASYGTGASGASTLTSVDVSNGSVVKSGDSLFASDALNISEVELSAREGSAPMIRVKAAKGLAKTFFTPMDIVLSPSTKIGLGLASSESEKLPAPPAPPTKTAGAVVSGSSSSVPLIVAGTVFAGTMIYIMNGDHR